MDKPALLFYSGLAAAAYSVVAALAYYTYAGPQLITPSRAKRLVKEGAVVVDVRTALEFKAGHFPGAVHIPVTNIGKAALPKKMFSSPVVVYCNTGQRARYAAERLLERGVPDVYYIAGTYKSL